MSRATKFALAIVLLFVLIVGAISVNFLMVEHAVSRSQQQWCDTLTLLTSHPVPYPPDAAKNPSRLADYELYEDFVKIRVEFGCRNA